MTDLPANSLRGLIGFIALACMVFGALILWGIGGALFVGGLFVALDVSSDEVVERVTKTTRGKSSPISSHHSQTEAG